MLRRLLSLFAVLTLACASAQAHVPERSLLPPGELASPAKTAPRGFAATAETAAKEKTRVSACRVGENWHPPLKLASSMQFTGHYREREGTSYYAQQRYYRPGLGRFTRVDPWEGDPLRPITLNKYLYANGNPLLYVDPDGRCGMQLGDDFCVLGAAVANGWSPEEFHSELKVRAQAERVASSDALHLGKGVAEVGLEGVWDSVKLALTYARMQGGDTQARDELASRVNTAIDVAANPMQAYTAASAAYGEGLDEQHRRMLAGDAAGAWEARGRLAAPFVYALAPMLSRSSTISSGASVRRVQQQGQAVAVAEGSGIGPRVVEGQGLPTGITYEGPVYRAVNPAYADGAWRINSYNIADNHRYSSPGRGALYTSTSQEGVLGELRHYRIDPQSRVMLEKQVRVENVLDLTDPTVQRQLGTNHFDLTRSSQSPAELRSGMGNPSDDYFFTHAIGDLSRSRYSGMLVPSARESGTSHLVLFENLTIPQR